MKEKKVSLFYKNLFLQNIFRGLRFEGIFVEIKFFKRLFVLKNLAIFALGIDCELIIVEKLLRYLIPIVLFAVAVYGNFGKLDSLSDTSPTIGVTSEVLSCYSDAVCDSDYLLQSPITFSHSFRLQTTTKRTNNTCKNNFEFLKFGRIADCNITNLLQKKSITRYSLFIKPSHRMICLDKLLI
ncbi:MAG: hypothetical protein U0L37_08815 [Bacteroidales bacterium]|nr:hypothetical protein [Bacteroidales bacterium]